MQTKVLKTVLTALALISWNALSATFQEVGGQVVIEAEHFDQRTVNDDGHHWHIVTDDDGVDGFGDSLATWGSNAGAAFANARNNQYIQVFPDVSGGGQNKNTVALVGTDPYVTYKVQIQTVGTYRLWLHWGGYDGSSDSMYAQIVELIDGTGPNADWYRFATNTTGDFALASWNSDGAPENVGGGPGGEVPATWNITTPGIYTIKLSQREDGLAVDALILQLASLPAPTEPGPAESSSLPTVDVTPPTVVKVRGSGTLNRVTVSFSEPVDPASGTNAINYTLSGGVTVSSARIGVDGKSVTLTTSAQTSGTGYTLTVKDIKDRATPANTLSPNPTTANFTGFVLAGGLATLELWTAIPGTPVQGLLDDPRYPNFPGQVLYLSSFNTRDVLPTDAFENYGGRITALFSPPQNGNYNFFIRSDDHSELRMSQDQNPANAAKIAEETDCCVAFLEPDENQADWRGQTTLTPVSLVAAQRYYIEAVYKEGTGGDYCQAAFRRDTDTTPAASLLPIPGQYLATYVSPDGITLTITQQPTDQTAPANTPVTFSVRATATSDFSTNATYQWQKASSGSSTFNDVAGATSRDYLIPFANSADNGAKFRAVVSLSSLTNKTSAEATLTVNTDNTPPTVLGASGTIQSVRVKFSEPLDSASATNRNNYPVSGGVTVNSATLVTTADKPAIVQLALTGATAGASYTLTVNDVKDRANNPVAANSTATFIAYSGFFDFDDGQVPAGTTVGGTTTLLPTGGIGGSGVLQLTPAVGSMQGGFGIPDLVNGETVTNLTVTFKLFIGQGSGNAADGFSFSFGPDLPIPPNTGEEGSGAGLIVAFDTYDNNTAPPAEAPAIGLKFSGIEFATTNLTKATLVNNRFVDVTIRINADGTLDLAHDGKNYFSKVDLTSQGYSPMSGATFLFGARTGGEWEQHLVDDVAILVNATATPTTTPTISVSKNANGQPVITFTGVLRVATEVTGSFQPVSGATNPYTVDTSVGTSRFYRASSQ